jgi:polygalacturonase
LYPLLHSVSIPLFGIMVAMQITSLVLGAAALAHAAPANLDARASCTFSDAAAAIKAKASCAAIVIKDMTVPAGTTLDLTSLKDGTTVSTPLLAKLKSTDTIQVTFQGTTTFAYKEWTGPLISVSGTNITVNGATGHVIDGNGPKWWDGKGGNGGKTKPKVSICAFPFPIFRSRVSSSTPTP